MPGRKWLALTLVQLLHGQPGEGENADADQDQQGGEECLKHGSSLNERYGGSTGPGPSLMGGIPARRFGACRGAGQSVSWFGRISVRRNGSGAAFFRAPH